MSEPIRLDDRAVIAVNGPEARSFLQGLITNDIEKVRPEKAIYAALLTPQGKVLFDFLIAEGDGALLIDCDRSARDGLIRRLSMYRLRAKVQIEPRDQLAVLVGLTGRPAQRGVTFEDPRLAELGHRSIGALAEMPSAVASARAWHDHRLALGVPEAGDFGSDRMFALDADLDELHAISFEKGCYVGQELTARMKHRGTARRRLLVAEAADGSTLSAGSELRANGHAIGEIVSAHGARGFALVRLDRLEEADGTPIDADGARIAVIKQDWLEA
jgi:folate-binding protein YgfZ